MSVKFQPDRLQLGMLDLADPDRLSILVSKALYDLNARHDGLHMSKRDSRRLPGAAFKGCRTA